MRADPRAGFSYHPEFLPPSEEEALAEEIRRLEFGEVRLRGVAARRRAAHFGWRYGYESWKIEPGPPLPEFLAPLRARAAALISLHPHPFAEVLVNEDPAGARIGWRRGAAPVG